MLAPVSFPGYLASAIAVGAINPGGTVAFYSNGDAQLDIAGFGGFNTGRCIGNIVTTDLWGPKGCNDGPSGNENYTSTFSGTSAAAPMVSAAVALLLSREPTLTLSAVKSRLYSSADPWGPLQDYGAGKLNIARTLFGPVNASISGPSNITGSPQTWTAGASGALAPYTYKWELQPFCSGSWSVVGTGSTLVMTGTPGESFRLRATVTSAARYSGQSIKLVGGFMVC
jgi:subtilisin family serine protease